VNIWVEFVFEGQRNDKILIRLGGRDILGGWRVTFTVKSYRNF
jgi:hypothetical protein